LNRNGLSEDLNNDNEVAVLIAEGREFQSSGAQTEKERRPYDFTREFPRLRRTSEEERSFLEGL
jgi:hypothetical protein